MKRLFSFFTLTGMIGSLLVGTGLLASVSNRPSSDGPVGVVAVSSVQNVSSDVLSISESFDIPELELAVRVFKPWFNDGGLLECFDADRSAGLLVSIDSGKPVGILALPISDFDQLHALTKPFIESTKEQGDGVYLIIPKKKSDKPAYVREMDNWLLVSDRKSSLLSDLPDLQSAFDGALGENDIAAQLIVSNVPEQMREKMLAKIATKMKEDLAREMDGNKQLDNFRESLGKSVYNMIAHAANEMDTITLGAAFDRETTSISLSLDLRAIDGSDVAQYFNSASEMKPQFTGFQSSDAVLSCYSVSQCPITGQIDWQSLSKVVKGEISKQIDTKEQDSEKAEAAKAWFNELVDLFQDTVANKRRESGLCVIAGPNRATIAAGVYFEDGYALEEQLGEALEVIRNEHPDEVARHLTTDVADIEGVHIHSITIEIPDDAKDRRKAVALVGEELDVIVGFGPQAVYLAAGKDALSQLKQCIAASNSADMPETSSKITLSSSELLEMVAALGDKEKERENAKAALKVLGGYGDQDDVELTVTPIDNGSSISLKVEQGLLQTIVAAERAKNNK